MTTATVKEFGDTYHHPPCTAENTITAIRTVCSQHSPMDYKDFLKAIKQFQLNGIVKLCWIGWALLDPSFFLNPKVLHHFHRMFWDHDIQWCISATGATELDFHFSLIQTLIGYRSFSKGILKLKQVTGRDHRVVQRYIIAAVNGSVPRQFLIAICMLLDLRYLAQHRRSLLSPSKGLPVPYRSSMITRRQLYVRVQELTGRYLNSSSSRA